ncbi:MAG: hypothetical protein IJ658_14075 [Kiritimatiellae bacterium]|nr:hypothetical protein [Kiritimatiellia bacterium]
MTDETNNTADYLGQGLRGPIWALFGVATAAAAKYALGGNFPLLGGGMPAGGNPPWARDLTYERELTKANAETAALQAKLDCQNAILASERRYEDKFDAIEREICAQKVHNATNDGVVGTIAAQTAQLMKMTAPYIVQPVMAASEGALNFVPPALAAAKTTTATTAAAA